MVSLTSISSTNHAWKKVNSEDNIIVYNCEVEGSKFKKSKVETTINFSNLKNAEIVLKDVSKYKNWQPNCSSSTLIKAEGNKIYTYLTFDAPWPVSDRDLILESTFIKSENKLMMKTTCKPNYIKKDDDFVRITCSEGLWEIEKKMKAPYLLEIQIIPVLAATYLLGLALVQLKTCLLKLFKGLKRL